MPDNSTGITIDMKIVNGGDFNAFIDSAIKPVKALNSAVRKLVLALDDLDDASGSFKGATKNVKEFAKLVQTIQSTGTQGRGSLENLSRTAGTIREFLLTTSAISKQIGAGSFKNLSKFGAVMKQFATALSAMDKIKRPENLLVAEEAVRALKRMLEAVATGIPRTNILARQMNGLSRIKPLARMLSSALQEFDKIKRPDSLQGAVAGMKAIQMGMKVLGQLNFNLITRINRGRLMGQLVNVAKGLAKVFMQFDRIKRPESIEGIAKGIRSLSQLIEELRKVAKAGERLSNAGPKGLFTQAGTLISGLGKFMRLVSKNLKSFAKFKPSQIKSLETASKMIQSIVTLVKMIQTEASFSTSGGAVSGTIDTKSISGIEDLVQVMKILSKSLKSIGKVNPSQVKAMSEMIKAVVAVRKTAGSSEKIDTTGLRGTVKDLVVIAKDISKVRFDPAKVAAIAQFSQSLGKAVLGGSGSGSSGGISKLRQLADMATSVAGTISRVFVKAATTVGGAFRSVLAKNPFSGVVKNVRLVAKYALKSASTIARVFVKAATTVGGAFKSLFSKNPFLGIVKNARNAAKSVISSISGISRSMRRFGREMSQLGTQMLASGGIAGFIQSQGVQMTMGFESIMKQVEVLGGVSGKELEKANELVLQLGESSVFSASEVASSVLELSKAGLSFQDISVALEDILNLAAAGEIAIDDAATLVIQAVGAFENLNFGDATMIVDTFVAAANIGTATVADLAAAFGYVGNTANTFGQDLEVVTAALTLMMDRGIEGSRAGRSLDAFMRALINPSAKAAGAIGDITAELIDMGLVAGDASLQADSQGNFRDLNEILGLISITTKDYSEALRASTLSDIAGSANAGRALLSLLGMYEDGTLVLDEYIVKQEESASAAEVGAALMDTTLGSIEEMSGAFETLLIKGLTPVLKYGIRPLVDGITWIIRQISQLPGPVLAGIAALTGLATIFTTLTGAMLIFMGITTQLIGFALVPLVGVLTALINPLRLILALTAGQGIFMVMFAGAALVLPLILGMVGAIRTLRAGFEEFPFFLDGIVLAFNNMRSAVGSAVSALSKVASSFFTALFGGAGTPDISVLVAISNTLTVLFDTVTKGLGDLQQFASIMDVVFTAVGNLGTNLDAMFVSLFKLAQGNSIFEAILGKGFSQGTFVSWLSEIVWAILNFRAVLSSATKPIVDFFAAISEGGFTGDAFVELFTGLGSVGAQAAGAFLEVLETVFNTSFGALPDLLRTGDLSMIFKTLGSRLIESLVLGMVSKAGFITTIFAGIFDKIFGTNILDPIKRIFKELERSVKIIFSLIKKIFSVAGGGGGEGGKGAIATFIEGLFGGIADVLEDINDFFRLFDIIVEKAGMITSLSFLTQQSGLLQLLFGDDIVTAKATMEEVAQGLSRIADGVKAFFFALKDLISGDINLSTALGEMFGGLSDIGGGAMGIATAIWSNLKTAFSSVVGGAADIATTIWSNLKAAFDNIDWADVLSSATFSVADLLGINLSDEDKLAIEDGINSVMAFISTTMENVMSVVKNPNTKFITNFVEDLKVAFSSIDWEDILKSTTFSVADLLGLDLSDEDKLAIEEGVKSAIAFIGTTLDNTLAAVKGPGADLVIGFFKDLKEAADALAKADTDSIIALGIGLGGLIAIISGPALLAAAAPLLAVAGGFVLLKGALRGLPDLLEAIDSGLSGDWEGMFGSLGDAVTAAWDGMKDAALQILDFIATILGFDDVFSQENYDAGVEAWKTMVDGMGALVEALIPRLDIIFDEIRVKVLDLAATIVEKIEGALSFEAQEIAGVEIIGAQTLDIGGDKLRDEANAAILELQNQKISLKFGIEEDAATTLATDVQNLFGAGDTTQDFIGPTADEIAASQQEEVDAIYGVYDFTEEPLITGEDMFGTSSLEESANTATTATDGFLDSVVTGSAVAMTSVNNLDMTIASPPDTSLPIKAVNTMSMSLIDDVTLATESVQDLKGELSTMWDVSVVVTFIAPDGGASILPPEAPSSAAGRAGGGPVFANQLYEVAENGISELLRIQGKTFLIPGTNGTVIPPEDTAGTVSSAVRNDEYRPRETSVGGGQTTIYEDNSSLTVEVNGSDLPMDELEVAVFNAIDKNNQERSRSIRARLESVGRG